MFKSLKKAFTLSEVLITLGIIGVVAAVTIPVISTKTQVAKKRAILKKSVAEIAQAYAVAKVKYHVDNFAYMNWSEYINSANNCESQKLDNDAIPTPCAVLNSTLMSIKSRKIDYSDEYIIRIPSGADVRIGSSYNDRRTYSMMIYPLGYTSKGSGCFSSNCDDASFFRFNVRDDGTLITVYGSVTNFIYAK